MDYRVIYQEQKEDGTELLVRYPVVEDAPAMTAYINALSAEQTYILMQGEQKTLEEEEVFVQSQLKSIEEGRAVMLLLFVNGELAGIAGGEQKEYALSPQINLGLSVALKYRSQGLGDLLFGLLCVECEERLAGEMLQLSVFANNEAGIHLYEKHGFTECGRIPQGILHKGELVDEIYMYRPMPN